MERLYEKLMQYETSDYYPFHMPGHKRNLSFFDSAEAGSRECNSRRPFCGNQNLHIWDSYGIDITEIEGFDNLHDADGILADAMQRAAKVCGAGKSYFLVNGSTCGLLAGISACVQHGDTIIVARNCHKAVYHAIELNELKPLYLYPQEIKEYGICGGISPEKLKEMLITYKNVKLVVVTSPTYEGVVSDIASLAETAHGFGVPLLVDEAHGAHFGYHDSFPKSALSYGADIVIQSVHKTLPAFTQTALLHLGKNTFAEQGRIEKYLSIYQTSSPSYLFMASIDWCMDFLEKNSKSAFESYKKILNEFYEQIKSLSCLEVFFPFNWKKEKRIKYGIFDFDSSKLNIFVKGESSITGSKLYDILLKEYHLQMEMVSKDYVLAMTSICDTKEGMRRLLEALQEIDTKEAGKEKSVTRIENEKGFNKMEKFLNCMQCNPIRYTPYQVQCMKEKSVLFDKSQGKISKEYIYLYPPGIPLLVPGEEVTFSLIEKIAVYQKMNLKICGWKRAGHISVIDGLE